jgi:pyridoxal/pyridoxine/pyridoxamine kinase
MTQIAVNDRLIEKARTVTTLDNDQEIMEAALNGFIGHAEAHQHAMKIIEEINSGRKTLFWDPEFAGCDKGDVK